MRGDVHMGRLTRRRREKCSKSTPSLIIADRDKNHADRRHSSLRVSPAIYSPKSAAKLLEICQVAAHT